MTAEMMLAGVKESDKEKTVEAWKLLFSRFYRALEQVMTLIQCKKMVTFSPSKSIKAARSSKESKTKAQAAEAAAAILSVPLSHRPTVNSDYALNHSSGFEEATFANSTAFRNEEYYT